MHGLPATSTKLATGGDQGRDAIEFRAQKLSLVSDDEVINTLATVIGNMYVLGRALADHQLVKGLFGGSVWVSQQLSKSDV